MSRNGDRHDRSSAAKVCASRKTRTLKNQRVRHPRTSALGSGCLSGSAILRSRLRCKMETRKSMRPPRNLTTIQNPGGASYQFDAENRITQAATSLGSGSYFYNSDGQRVKRVAAGNTTLYATQGSVGPMLTEFLNGTWHREYFYVNGELVASHENDANWVHYYLNDHLGTPRIIVAPGGNVISRHDYYPFGQERTTWTDSDTHKFTG